MTRRFLTVDIVLAIHGILIEETGGATGVRDVGALKSAVMRPQMEYYNGIIEETGALMESLAINHSFMDGNKRIAFAAGDTFLLMNATMTGSLMLRAERSTSLPEYRRELERR